jgi:hypothetical protein
MMEATDLSVISESEAIGVFDLSYKRRNKYK